MAMLKVGDRAPEFSFCAQDGNKYSLCDFKGTKVVLYFYPKDDSGACTLQACAFRDGYAAIQKKGAVVIGVSPNTLSSHEKFAKKYRLNFLLASDEEKQILKSYGVWKQKQLFGRKYIGVIRTTFILNEEGIITHIFPKVRVKGHVQKVLQALSE